MGTSGRHDGRNSDRGVSLTPALLLAGAAMCVGALLGPGGASGLADEAASAAMQRSRDARPGRGIVNPADQRKTIIVELQRLNGRIESLEKALDGPIEVEVVSMPGAGEGSD